MGCPQHSPYCAQLVGGSPDCRVLKSISAFVLSPYLLGLCPGSNWDQQAYCFRLISGSLKIPVETAHQLCRHFFHHTALCRSPPNLPYFHPLSFWTSAVFGWLPQYYAALFPISKVAEHLNCLHISSSDDANQHRYPI